MKVYLFNRPESHLRSSFRSLYILQNLKVAKYICGIYFIINAAIAFIVFLFKLDINEITHIKNFLPSTYVVLCTLPFFYLLFFITEKKFRLTKNWLRLSQVVVVLFCLYLISRGMLNSFNAAGNPRNTIVTYMMWLVVVSVFFVFEYYETILVSAVCFLTFSLLLPYYQTDSGELIKNYLASVTLVIIFFCMSRYVFSYRASHFIQLNSIREKNLQIESTNHIKDEILAIVAHDLRNPLAAIESITMFKEMDDDGIDNAEYLAIVKASCQKAQIIINDLLEVARNDDDDSFEVEKTDLNVFLKQVVDEWLINKIEHIKVLYHQNDRAVYANINKTKIQRVIDNLLSNAAKFTAKGDRIDVFLKAENNECIIEVKDYGIGIPKDLLPFIFDRFSKAGRKGVHGEDSVGLGLNIVRQMIRKHRGDIIIQSTEQKGTTVTIKLPQALGSLPVG